MMRVTALQHVRVPSRPPNPDVPRALELPEQSSENVRSLPVSPDIDEVLPQLAELARRLAGADLSLIALVEDDENLRIVAAAGERKISVLGARLSLLKGSSATAIRTGRPYFSRGRRDRAGRRRDPALMRGLRDESLRSMLAIPIRRGNEVVGVLRVASRQERRYTREERQRLMLLANQAAVVIDNARVHGLEREARAEVEALLAATASLNAQDDPESVLRTLVEQAAMLTEADSAVYAVLRNGQLVRPAELRNGSWLDVEDQIAEHGILQRVWSTGRPYRSNDLAADPNPNRLVMERPKLRSRLTVPLTASEDRRLGLISLNNSRRAGGFSERDERLLVAICETGAAVLQRSHERAALREAEHSAAQRKQEVEALLQAADELNTAVEPAEVLQRVVSVAVELLDVEHAGIATYEDGHIVLRHTWFRGVWRPESREIFGERSLLRWVVRNRRSFRTDDLRHETAVEFLPVRENSPALRGVPQTALAVPILGKGGSVLGTLQLFDPKDGEPFSAEAQRLAEGIAHHAAVALERAAQTVELVRSERRLAALLEHVSDVIAILDADGSIRYESPAIERISGFRPSELVGQNAVMGIHPNDLAHAQRYFTRACQSSGLHEPLEFRFRHKDGTWRYVETVANNLLCDSSVQGVVMTSHDTTERQRLEEHLRRQAVTDSLTGLPNRSLFFDRLGHALSGAERRAGGVVVLYLDLDGFKGINDSLGHAAGDELLQSFSMRLLTDQRASDTVARLGGDEFAVLLEDISNPDGALEVAERILAQLCRPFLSREGQPLPISASIGVGFRIPGESLCSPDELVREADIAMYHAKTSGGGRAVLYAPDMGT